MIVWRLLKVNSMFLSFYFLKKSIWRSQMHTTLKIKFWYSLFFCQYTRLVHCSFEDVVKCDLLPLHFNITQLHLSSLQSLAFYYDPIRLYFKKLKILNYFATFLWHLEKQVNFQFLVMKRYLKYMYVYWGFSCWIFNKHYVKYIYLIVCRCFYCHIDS